MKQCLHHSVCPTLSPRQPPFKERHSVSSVRPSDRRPAPGWPRHPPDRCQHRSDAQPHPRGCPAARPVAAGGQLRRDAGPDRCQRRPQRADVPLPHHHQLHRHHTGRLDLPRRDRRALPRGQPERPAGRRQLATSRRTGSCWPSWPSTTWWWSTPTCSTPPTARACTGSSTRSTTRSTSTRQFETTDAKRMYACFDQPDLKATFTLHVTAPAHWKLVSNGAVVEVEDPDRTRTRTPGATARDQDGRTSPPRRG